jgi:uncharacterized protein YneF (UPF0154 family)
MTGTPSDLPFASRTSLTPSADQIRWPEALRSAALGGMLLTVALVVPFGSPLLLMLAAGGLTVTLYARRVQVSPTRGLGARIGATGGLFGWLMLLLILLLEATLGGGHLVSALREAVQQQIANNPDPRAQQVLAALNSPAGLAVVVTFGMLFFLVVALICGALGGALGAYFFSRFRDKERR